MDNKRNYLLAVIVLIILSATLFSGCYSTRQCQKHCSSCLSDSSVKETDSITSSIDSSRKESVKVDTLHIHHYIPGPVQFLENPCAMLCDSLGQLKPFHKEEHKNGMTSTIDSKDGKLNFGCNQDSMLIVQLTLERELTIRKNVSEKKTKETIKNLLGKQKSGWEIWLERTYKYSAWFLYVCIIGILLFLFAYWYFHRGQSLRKV